MATQVRRGILSARTDTAMCRTTPSTTPTQVGTSGIVSKGWNYAKKTASNAWNGENILMEEINNEYKSNSFKKKRTL